MKIVHILHPCYHPKIIGHVRLSRKAGMGIGDRNEGKDGNVGNQDWNDGNVGNEGGNTGNQGGDEGNTGSQGENVGTRGGDAGT